MVDVPIHQVSTVVQRTPLVDTVIFMVTKKSKPTKTPTPSTTQAQVTSASEFDPSSKFDQVDDKSMQAEETVEEPIQEMAMDVKELVNDEVVKEHLQGDAAPKQDKSNWFMQPPRLETPVLEWQKEPNADDGSEWNWFNDLTNLEGDIYPLDISKPLLYNQFGYGYMKEIVVRRAHLKEYSFREADFYKLHLNDIEDLFLLYVQCKIHNLTGDKIIHLVNSLQFMIIADADNRPPMLDKTMYDSWKSRMELYIENRENGRMILNSIENGPFIWPTVKENSESRKKKYEELSASEKLQADCDLKATNIVLQGIPPDVYAIVNHHKVSK
nr:retrovirus-related Pol polyprotein from transposon TNT 1-94 [Tanacetum cinerariifolium]